MLELRLARSRLLHERPVLCSFVALRQESILGILELLLKVLESSFVVGLKEMMILNNFERTNQKLFLQALDFSLVLVTNVVDGDRHRLFVGVLHVERLLKQSTLVFASFLDLDVLHRHRSLEFLPDFFLIDNQ